MNNSLNAESAKSKLFDLYSQDGYVNAFLHIRWWHARLEEVAGFVPSSGTILDLGCGYGIFSNYLALASKERNVIGVELSGRKLKYAQKNLPNVQFLNDDITRLKIPPCDAIVMLDVLHHLNSFEDQEKLLRNCVNLLSDGGILLLKDIDTKPPLKFFLTRIVDNTLYPGDKFYFRGENDFKQLLAKLNLEVEFHPIHKGVPLSHVVYIARKKK